MKTYSCTLDRVARNAPWLILVLAAFSMVTLFPIKAGQKEGTFFPVYFAPALLLAVYIVCYYLKPLAITIGDHSVTIKRKLSPVNILFSDISSIRKVPDMAFAVRTFGNGGVFGYTGKYYKKGIGSMSWYCTQRENYILIAKTNGRKIVITPDDADGFIRDMQRINQQWLADNTTA